MRIISIFLCFLLISCDGVSSKYSTYEEAKSHQLFERGWLPEILPESTTEIFTNNNLDLNTSHGSFQIPPEDIVEFTNRLQKVAESEYEYRESLRKDLWVFSIKKDGKVTYVLQTE